MFGEISLMAWMGSAIVFAIGGGAGFFIARQIKDKRTLELEQQLQATQSKLSEYQSDVNRHFLKSSLLFNKLTDNYREVYEHLATGAQKLCNEIPITTALDLPDTKILSAAVATRVEGISAAQPETGVTAPETTGVEDHSAEQRASKQSAQQSAPQSELQQEQQTEEEHLGVESITTHQAAFENNTETDKTESTAPRTAAKTATTKATAKPTENSSENDMPTISEEELKALDANEQKENEADDVHLGAESTPGVELEHHKTHPAIH